MMYWREEDFDETINAFHIGDNLKENKEIRAYLRKHYNNRRPIITKKKFEDIWIRFKFDMAALRPNKEIYELLNRLINKQKK